ncbi:aryl-sulfate sulfotransferase [Chloroflexota bacterium]
MPLYEPTELRYCDKSKVFNGYTLFGAGATSYLLDMDGKIVHTWPGGSRPRLLDNGNFMDSTASDERTYNGFHELDWEGNVVWKYQDTRENYSLHHDFIRRFNKKLNAPTTTYIANRAVPHDEAIAIGCNPAHGPYEGAQMDTIVEVDMDGNIIWEWRFLDHLVQDIDPAKPNYVGNGKTLADYPGRLNINLPGRPLQTDWLHCNSLDFNEDLDQVVINTVQGEFWVIDHGNTFIPDNPEGSIALAAGPAGDFLYRFGDPARYGQGEPPSILEDWTASSTGTKQIGGSHNIQWIRPGLPGAGHFLIFNNAQYLFERTPQSCILEINGFLDANGNDTGSYVNPPDAGYYTWEPPYAKATHKQPRQMSNQIVWIYASKGNTAFFSHIGSGCQRLPNNNTLICGSTEGHIFEVTSDGELAWEFISPVIRGSGDILEGMPDRAPMSNSVWRAYRYTADHPALAGKDLTPKGTIVKGYNN